MHRTSEDLGMFLVKQSQRYSSEISRASIVLRVISLAIITYYIDLTFERPTATCTVSVRQLFRFDNLFETVLFSHIAQQSNTMEKSVNATYLAAAGVLITATDPTTKTNWILLGLSTNRFLCHFHGYNDYQKASNAKSIPYTTAAHETGAFILRINFIIFELIFTSRLN